MTQTTASSKYGDYRPTACLAGFCYEDGFMLTRREYDAALTALFVGYQIKWSELRAHAECQRHNRHTR